MDTAKYLNMIQNNPYVIERIENPTEEMKLLAVQTNGLALQYIPHPSEAAVANTPRAIQFLENPSETLLLQAVQHGWNNLAYIKHPSEALIQAALQQSGWAIKYIDHPSEALQLQAVQKNYDAVQYIKEPSLAVQKAAVKANYEALRYIPNPDYEAVCLAVKQTEKAVRLVATVTKEQFMHFIQLNILVLKYVPKGIAIPKDELVDILKNVLSQDDVDEAYVRNVINCPMDALSPLEKVRLVDAYGSKKAKRITVDEKLTIQ